MGAAAASLLLATGGALLVASARRSAGSIEAAEGDITGMVGVGTLIDRAEVLINVITEQAADMPEDIAARNVRAFLQVIRQAEGTAGGAVDPYRVCYGYTHTIRDWSEHPAVSGEWAGVVLSDDMCRRAGFGPGCRSTAAGAYQIIRSTWRGLRNDLGLPDFGPQSQDAAAVELIRRRGALDEVKAGRFANAIYRCRGEWASLPGNYAGQGQRSMPTLAGWFTAAGGTLYA